MTIDIHQDRKVIFEKYSLKIAIINNLINTIENCFVKEYGPYCRVYFQNDKALFEENYLCGDAAFNIYGPVWDDIQKQLQFDFKTTQYFIAEALREYFQVNTYQVNPKGFRYY